MNSEEPFESVSIDYSDLDLSVTVHANEIELFEASTGSFIYTHPLKSDAQVSKVYVISPELVLFKGTDGRVYEVKVSLLGQRSTLSTKDEYILALQYEEELAIGAHFGLYGWGLFTVKENELLSLFFQETEALRTGLLYGQGSKIVSILGYRDGRICALEAEPTAPSSFDSQQAQSWNVETGQKIVSLLRVEGQLVSIHQSGVVQLRDLKTGELLHSRQVAETRPNCATLHNDTLFLGIWNGEAIALDMRTWEVRWTKPLSQTTIMGCAVLNDGVCFVDNGNGIYWLDAQTGDKRREIQSEIGVVSNPLQFKHTVVVGGSAYLQAFSEERCVEKHYWQDNLQRSLCPYPKGVLVGNDNGNISLWTHGSLRVRAAPGYEIALRKYENQLSKLIETVLKIAEQQEENGDE